MNCRYCKKFLNHKFIDLGYAPPSNAYLTVSDLNKPEIYYPLKVMVCDKCWLVQTEDYTKAGELFNSNYAYFSSTSIFWLKHAKNYAKKIIEQLNLNSDSFVIEVASNDGYLLKNFHETGVPCLGIEPTASTAKEAEKLGIPVIREFFGEKLGKKLASEHKKADLIVGNNVYAHVPDINDFTKGLKLALKLNGVITLEFPHLMHLIKNTQFDTIYHEHFSYLSLFTVSKIFASAGLRIWDVEKISTHGGSLRVFGCHADDKRQTTKKVQQVIYEEISLGMQRLDFYLKFQQRADKIKNDLIEFLIKEKKKRKKIAAYGAAAKGNTLLNYAGVKSDLIPFVCDASSAKQNKYMPGSHIPIVSEEKIREFKPDYVLIMPWNIKEEIIKQLSYIKEWNAKFVIVASKLRIIK